MPRRTRSLSDLLKQVPPYTLSCIGFVVILTLCWLPASTVKEPQWFHIPNADKAVHFAMFFVWAFCLQKDFQKAIRNTLQLILLVLLLGLFTAALTEMLQPIVSNRMRDWADACADSAGTIVSIILFSIFCKKPFHEKK